jgi:hypothetical protein
MNRQMLNAKIHRAGITGSGRISARNEIAEVNSNVDLLEVA